MHRQSNHEDLKADPDQIKYVHTDSLSYEIDPIDIDNHRHHHTAASEWSLSFRSTAPMADSPPLCAVRTLNATLALVS